MKYYRITKKDGDKVDITITETVATEIRKFVAAKREAAYKIGKSTSDFQLRLAALEKIANCKATDWEMLDGGAR